MHNKAEVKQATLKYFKDDELATNVWMTKYALKNSAGDFVEKTLVIIQIRVLWKDSDRVWPRSRPPPFYRPETGDCFFDGYFGRQPG